MSDENRALVDGICRQAAERMQKYDHLKNQLGEVVFTRRIELIGEITGLRVALCLAMGWNLDADADKDGKADDFILAWAGRNLPEWSEQP